MRRSLSSGKRTSGNRTSGNRIVLLLAVCLLVLVTFPADSFSRDKAKPPVSKVRRRAAPPLELIKIDSVLDPKNFNVINRKMMMPANQTIRLQTARSQMKSGNFVGATDLLELIYRDFPYDPRVVNLLRECYVELKRYFSAIEILKRQIAAQPLNITPFYDLADVYFKFGKTDSALVQVEYVMSYGSDSSGVMRYLFGLKETLRLLTNNWHDTLTISYAKTFREITSDNALFADIVAEALERQRDFRGAVRESFKLLKTDTTKIGRRRKSGDFRLSQLLGYPEAKEEVKDELLKMLITEPADTLALKYLGQLYMKAHQFDPAYYMYVRFDSLIESDGRQLLNYLRECYDRKLYSQAIRMGEYILAVYPDKPLSFATSFYLGRSLRQQKNWAGALAVFERVNRKAPVESDRAEALYLLGEIMMDDLARYDTARVLFQAISGLSRSGSWRLPARFRLAELDIIDGDMSGARQRLDDLARLGANSDFTEKAGYYLARLSLFEALLDSAGSEFKRLITRYPRGLYVNDALSVMMVLQQGAEGEPELLNLYARAEYFKERRVQDSLIQTLTLLAEHKDTTLADVALLDLGNIYLQSEDTSRSLDYFNAVGERFPDSYFAPFASKLKGDIYFADPAKKAQALAMYRALLKNHGGYPFVAELRKKLKEAADEEEKSKKRKAVAEA